MQSEHEQTANSQPKTRAATLALIGCVLAMIGGVVLGKSPAALRSEVNPSATRRLA